MLYDIVHLIVSSLNIITCLSTRHSFTIGFKRGGCVCGGGGVGGGEQHFNGGLLLF